tara:strand:+ start:28 stop:615 length:588 start_codon:yes stop_codon:yes gene_type:complete
MKKLSLYVFLFLIVGNTGYATDIRDFQIEGISIGDTLLRYSTQEEIDISENNSSIMKDKTGKERYRIIFLNTITANEYETIQITYKINDKNYIIHSIDGSINFPNKFQECKNKMKVIVNDLKNIFIDSKLRNTDGKHLADKSGKSIHSSTYFDLSNGQVHVWCVLWSDEMNYDDGLAVTLRSKEYTNFLINENSY